MGGNGLNTDYARVNKDNACLERAYHKRFLLYIGKMVLIFTRFEKKYKQLLPMFFFVSFGF